MPDVIDWRDAVSPASLDRVAAALRAGKVVVLPTEAGYEGVVSGLNADAVGKLAKVATPDSLAVVLSEAPEVFDWLPHLRGAGRRLIRTFWPGPLTIFSAAGALMGLARHLPAEVQRRIIRESQIAVRSPDHEWPAPMRRLVAAPLVSAPLPGFPRELNQLQGREQFDLIVDGGPSPFVKPPTQVQVDSGVTIVREGAVPRAEVEVATPCHILFLCTGNTCRSPLAEGLCRLLLSAKVACAPADLPKHGFVVQSAGLAAGAGNPATLEGIAAGQPYGADLNGHCSQPLTLDLLAQADLVFTMTWSQWGMLRGLRAPLAATVQLLATDGADIADPIGCADEVYRLCAAQIWQSLNERMPELLEA